jgi:hypothetical protein
MINRKRNFEILLNQLEELNNCAEFNLLYNVLKWKKLENPLNVLHELYEQKLVYQLNPNKIEPLKDYLTRSIGYIHNKRNFIKSRELIEKIDSSLEIRLYNYFFKLSFVDSFANFAVADIVHNLLFETEHPDKEAMSKFNAIRRENLDIFNEVRIALFDGEFDEEKVLSEIKKFKKLEYTGNASVLDDRDIAAINEYNAATADLQGAIGKYVAITKQAPEKLVSKYLASLKAANSQNSSNINSGDTTFQTREEMYLTIANTDAIDKYIEHLKSFVKINGKHLGGGKFKYKLGDFFIEQKKYDFDLGSIDVSDTQGKLFSLRKACHREIGDEDYVLTYSNDKIIFSGAFPLAEMEQISRLLNTSFYPKDRKIIEDFLTKIANSSAEIAEKINNQLPKGTEHLKSLEDFGFNPLENRELYQAKEFAENRTRCELNHLSEKTPANEFSRIMENKLRKDFKIDAKKF